MAYSLYFPVRPVRVPDHNFHGPTNELHVFQSLYIPAKYPKIPK